MKRRQLLQSIPLLYASPALFAQSVARIDVSATDVAGKPLPGFFSPTQLAALRKLSELMLPAIGGSPGAIDAGAPEFLDFLVGQSTGPVQTLYRGGLDSLNARATAKHGKAFSALDAAQADAILSPLRQAWTWKEPTDSFAVFLRHAKADILTATMNSREWITASQRGGNGTYWLPPE